MLFDALSRLPVIGFRSTQEYRRLHALIEEMQAMASDPQVRPFEPLPSVSEWSPAQHFFHCAAIAGEVLEWLNARCRGDLRNDPRGEPAGRPNAVGCFILLAGRIPRGRSKTPSPFAPPQHPEAGALQGRLKAILAALHALQPHQAQLEHMGGRMKHPRMGMLNPREWLRFLQVHTHHHQRIVREVAAQRGKA